jgi:uncharacterized damage-inducible protein DinB
MSLALIRGLYDYHRWANRRLFDTATAAGEDLVSRDVGMQFSYTTIRRMFGHLYGADRIWMARWTGASLTTIPGAEFATLASIRAPWDDVEREQRAFIEGLSEVDLERVIQYTNPEGKQFRALLGPLLQHVANHATHHRSEIATMLTMVSGSPPGTGLARFLALRSGQEQL